MVAEAGLRMPAERDTGVGGIGGAGEVQRRSRGSPGETVIISGEQATDTKKRKDRRRRRNEDGGGEWRRAGVSEADAGTAAGEQGGTRGIPGDLADKELAHRRCGATTGPGWVHVVSQLWSANRELVQRLRRGGDKDDNAVRTNVRGDRQLKTRNFSRKRMAAL